jgi:hypothetical protein
MQHLSRLEWPKQEQQIEKLRKDHKDDEAKLKAEIEKLEQSLTKSHPQTYFRNLDSGRTATSHWEYYEAKYAIAPKETLDQPPTSIQQIAVIPAGKWLNIELGNKLPDEGTLVVRVRANRGSKKSKAPPSLQMHFGWQASNEGRALMRVSQQDHPITATPGAAEFYQLAIPLGEIYPRNSVRRTSPMGATPSPSEYIRLVNSSASPGDIEIDYIEVQAPVYDQWPPESHRRIFFESENSANELVYECRCVNQQWSKVRECDLEWSKPSNRHGCNCWLRQYRLSINRTKDEVGRVGIRRYRIGGIRESNAIQGAADRTTSECVCHNRRLSRACHQQATQREKRKQSKNHSKNLYKNG